MTSVGALHVGDQDVQGAVRMPLQPQQVHVAPDQPAVEFGLQAGLEQEDGLAGGELAGLLDDLVVVVGPVVGLADASRRSGPCGTAWRVCFSMPSSKSWPDSDSSGVIRCGITS